MITISPDIEYKPERDLPIRGIRYAPYEELKQQMEQIDQRQKDAGELIGRFVKLDDGPTTCTYQITALTHTTATINHSDGLPDTHPHPAIGEWATLDRQHIQEIVDHQDRAAAAEAEAKANGWW